MLPLLENDFVFWTSAILLFVISLYTASKVYHLLKSKVKDANYKRNLHKNIVNTLLSICLIVVLFLAPKNNENNVQERGPFVLDLSSVKYDFELIDEENKPKKLVCKKAVIKNIENEIEYNQWTQIEDDIIFENVSSGKYELTLQIEGYNEFTQQNLDVGLKELETKNLHAYKTSSKFLLVENPEFGDWGEWSDWQVKKVENDLLTEVEMKPLKADKQETDLVRTITYKDSEKPIYGKKVIQIGTQEKQVCKATEINEDNVQICSEWAIESTPVIKEVKVIIDYEESKKKYRILDFSGSEMLYRYRKRSLISGVKNTIYATDDSIEYLTSQGYQKIANNF